MNIKNQSTLNKIMLLVILSFILGEGNSQPKIPKMWVDKQRAFYRNNWFMNYKYPFISGTINKPDAPSIFYKANAFDKMVTHFEKIPGIENLRVYIASFSNENAQKVPKGFGNLLTLIFAPVGGGDKPKDLGEYYIILPDQDFKADSCKIDDEIKKEWIHNYEIKLARLPVDNEDEDNADPEGNKSDTKSILYPFDNILQLRDEIRYQKTKYEVDITGIRVDFASYTDAGREEELGRYPNRLILQFELTRRIGNQEIVFYIEDNKRDFRERVKMNRRELDLLKSNMYKSIDSLINIIEDKQRKLNLTNLKEKINQQIRLLTYDNGQICPPNCP